MQNDAAEVLSPNIRPILTDFIDAARVAFSDSQISVVLYGSGTERRVRDTSDVNLMLVLRTLERHTADKAREPLRAAQAAVQLKAMFILESEVSAAARFFSVKFANIIRRRLVL